MGEVKWTATRIDVANYCRMRYWLNYVEHASQVRLPAFPKGDVFHKGAEHFWKKLGSREEVAKKRNGKKYYDSESFAKYLMGIWNCENVIPDRLLREKIKKGELKGSELKEASQRLIAWNERQTPWTIKYQIRDAAKHMFEYLLEEGEPDFIKNELKFDFVLRGLYFEENPKNVFDLWFSGRIDEVRIRDGKVVIRDYKSGNPWIDMMKVKHDPQLTFYNAGLCSLIWKDEELADRLGVSDTRRKQYMGNPFFVDKDFIEEFFMIEAPVARERMLAKDPKVGLERLPNVLHKTYRTDAHFFELMRMIKGTQESVYNGIIYAERGRKCDACNIKEACERKLESADRDSPRQVDGQGLFDFAAVTYEKKFMVRNMVNPVTGGYIGEVKEEIDNKKLQKRFNFKRKTSY